MSSITIDEKHVSPDLDKETETEPSGLTPDEEREIELFLEDSRKYCDESNGNESDEIHLINLLRKKIEKSHLTIETVKKEWGLT